MRLSCSGVVFMLSQSFYYVFKVPLYFCWFFQPTIKPLASILEASMRKKEVPLSFLLLRLNYPHTKSVPPQNISLIPFLFAVIGLSFFFYICLAVRLSGIATNNGINV